MPNIEPTWTQHTPNMTPTKAQHWIFSIDKLPCSSQVSFRRLLRSHSGKFTFMQVGFCFFLRFRSQCRFRKVLVQCPGETPEASMWFRNVPVQCPGQVPAGSNAVSRWSSRRFRWFLKVPLRFRNQILEDSDSVHALSGLNSNQNFGKAENVPCEQLVFIFRFALHDVSEFVVCDWFLSAVWLGMLFWKTAWKRQPNHDQNR